MKVLNGLKLMRRVTESSTLARILEHMTENIIKATLESDSKQKMIVKAIAVKICEADKVVKDTLSYNQMVDYIYDDEPLGFEKDPLTSGKKASALDPL